MLFSFCWGTGREQKEPYWGSAQTSSAAALQPWSPLLLQTLLHLQPPMFDPQYLLHDQPLAAELRSHFRLLWGQFAFLTSGLYHLQRKDGNPHTEAKHMCCFPKSAERLNNSSMKCRLPLNTEFTATRSAYFNYFINEHGAKNSLLWYKSLVPDIMPPPPSQQPCSRVFTSLQFLWAGE